MAYQYSRFILAGIFWGSMGIFVRDLTALAGFTSIQIVCLRLVTAAVFFSIILWKKDSSGFRISGRDIPLFLGLGLCSILFFSTCYFTAIRMMTLSVEPMVATLTGIMVFHEYPAPLSALGIVCILAAIVILNR